MVFPIVNGKSLEVVRRPCPGTFGSPAPVEPGTPAPRSPMRRAPTAAAVHGTAVAPWGCRPAGASKFSKCLGLFNEAWENYRFFWVAVSFCCYICIHLGYLIISLGADGKCEGGTWKAKVCQHFCMNSLSLGASAHAARWVIQHAQSTVHMCPNINL